MSPPRPSAVRAVRCRFQESEAPPTLAPAGTELIQKSPIGRADAFRRSGGSVTTKLWSLTDMVQVIEDREKLRSKPHACRRFTSWAIRRHGRHDADTRPSVPNRLARLLAETAY